jgi:hypothetical protein
LDRAARIVFRRCDVVIRVIPIAAPFVNIVADVVKAEGVGSVTGDSFGTSLPARRIVGQRLRRIVSPRKLFLFESAACGAFPFGLGGKTEVASGLRAQPLAIAQCIVPGNAGDWLLRVIEMRIVPEWRWRGLRGLQKAPIFGVADLSGSEIERIDRDAMNRAFTVLAGVGSHEEG